MTGPTLDSLTARAFTIPTDEPESDGTLEWDATSVLVVQAHAGGETGLGYAYTSPGAASVVREQLAKAVQGRSAIDVRGRWAEMVAAVRNVGRPGIASGAISATDIALWDLAARLHGLSVVDLLAPVRDAVPVYGSGGFTSYSTERLCEQLGGWVDQGIAQVKMKVGRNPDDDEARVAAVRDAIGDAALFVDANGAHTPKQALEWAERFAGHGVSWLEEPVSSDDLEGLHVVRDRAPAGMDITAGEYGYTETYFRRMLAAGAVDCLQADVTRCGGITGFLHVSALCDAYGIDLSGHTAPTATAHAATAVWHLRHLEYFHDHIRVEALLFDGALQAQHGVLRPDRGQPGLGLSLREPDVRQWEITG